MSSFFLLAIVLLLNLSCSYFTGIPESDSGSIVTRITRDGSFVYEVDTGDDARDVYFVFSASPDSSSSYPTSVESLSVDGTLLPRPATPPLPAAFDADLTTSRGIAEFNRTSLAKYGIRGPSSSVFPAGPSGPRLSQSVGETTSFEIDELPITSAAATCRAAVNGVSVAVDSTPRNLAVWVSDEELESEGGPITDDMAEALAAAFLKPGLENDIFDWLTNILGAEWGSTPYSNLIDFTGDIHILLTDIGGDGSPDGGIVGFFWAGNNYTGISGSNQKIMFVIDSVMYSNHRDSSGGEGDGIWQPSDYWPMEIYSTLAHEFQHMIHFYQKGIVSGAGYSADAWVDEMCAMLAEDLLSDKLGVAGPRGVDPADPSAGSDTQNVEGRLPYYNAFTYLPLESSDSVWQDSENGWKYYSIVYAFGAWAARNYGGSEFLRRVVQSPNIDRRAVEGAAAAGGSFSSDLESLLGRWAVAVMGSDRVDMPAGYRLNRGDWFSSSSGGHAYRLGSIDFHRYVNGAGGTGPRYVTSGGTVPNLNASSNVYFRAASAQTGKREFQLTVPAGITVHTVIK